VTIVAAIDDHMLIGRDGGMAWHLPDDLRFFRKTTMGHTVLMGRTTHTSIGRALPGRPNIVLSRSASSVADGCVHAESIPEAISRTQTDELMVIGGARVYEQFVDRADRLVLSVIHQTFEGDTHFPAFDLGAWRCVSSTYVSVSPPGSPYAWTRRVLERDTTMERAGRWCAQPGRSFEALAKQAWEIPDSSP